MEKMPMKRKTTTNQKKRKPFQPDTPEELPRQDFAGDCYRAAVKWASASKRQGWTVVHGTVRNLEVGRLNHAWCERDGNVIDLATPVGMREFKRDEYYRILEPEVSKRYPAEHARLLFIRNRHYGPWDESEQLPEWLLAELDMDRCGSSSFAFAAARKPRPLA
jgi:hypothetical protein